MIEADIFTHFIINLISPSCPQLLSDTGDKKNANKPFSGLTQATKKNANQPFLGLRRFHMYSSNWHCTHV